MALANGTSVSTQQGVKHIEAFEIGDGVLSASLDTGTDDGMLKMDWYATVVTFSAGTGPAGEEPVMCHLVWGDEEEGNLICSQNHLVLMPSGKLKLAGMLKPGDWLVNAEGAEVAVKRISIGSYRGGVHHIGTEVEYNGTLNGHLLITEGVVSADFNLQIHTTQLEEEGLIEKD